MEEVLRRFERRVRDHLQRPGWQALGFPGALEDLDGAGGAARGPRRSTCAWSVIAANAVAAARARTTVASQRRVAEVSATAVM
jgi:hypothetical protein